MTSQSLLQRIAVVSDEVSPDFAETLAVCLPLGIRAYEIRGLRGGRVPYCESASIDQVLEMVDRHNLTLTGLSPGFFKSSYEDDRALHELDQGFDAAFVLLDRLGVRRMTVFTFLRSHASASIPQHAIDLLSRGAEKCRQAGVEMLIENVPSCWGDTGEHLGQIAKAVGVGVTWDPGNSERVGQVAFPDGYAAVRSSIRHLHLKNWTAQSGYTAILDGQANLTGQVAALLLDGYGGFFCIEPHQWANGAEAVRRNHMQLLALLTGIAA